MKKHQIDRLFEDKLANHAQEPSAKAQARFDELLAKKHKKPVIIWWQVAAAVALLAMSTFAYLNWKGEEQLTADLPENTPQLVEENVDPATARDETNDGALINESVEEEGVKPNINEPMIAETDVSAPDSEKNIGNNNAISQNLKLINDPSQAIAVVKEKVVQDEVESEAEPSSTAIEEIASDHITVADNTTEQLEENVDSGEIIEMTADLSESDIAVAINETPEAAPASVPAKKRLPVTIIYKSSNADPSLIAMQDIRSDVDSLANERDNSLKSILLSSDRSLLAELRKAKQDLFNLDFQTKSKKANN